MPDFVFSGDEAIARGAIDSGVSAAFAYPGTPSTEIMEFLQAHWDEYKATLSDEESAFVVAQWCSNEKTAYEAALGVSFVGRRAMVSMKHVGLNVAMDPFINSALVKINGGLVIVVADDPGMFSSQNEQDSRILADFAHIPCFEPSDQQEAYAMVRDAFAYSEIHEIPVLLRITTRLAHARAQIQVSPGMAPRALKKCSDPTAWTLMPGFARPRWRLLLKKYERFRADGEELAKLELRDKALGVITCGIGLRYYLENEDDWTALHGDKRPSHLHIDRYPLGRDKIQDLSNYVSKILVIEEGYPYIEREIVGTFDAPLPVLGKLSGDLSLSGELSADSVRLALGLAPLEALAASSIELPSRPPQFCQGCPHGDSFNALKAALQDEAEFLTTSDIGCYTLAALPPYNAVESCVDMGASIGMARGASCVGQKNAVAVIGDSTFYHSGMTNLLDAVAHRSKLTLLILDNSTTGMTGAQPTISPGSRMKTLIEGLGVEAAHIRELEAHRKSHDINVAAIREELTYDGVSVIILKRECLEYLKKVRQQ
jgi:indolepyruvate ferredoxin oxidoreductase alpha subunit